MVLDDEDDVLMPCNGATIVELELDVVNVDDDNDDGGCMADVFAGVIECNDNVADDTDDDWA